MALNYLSPVPWLYQGLWQSESYEATLYKSAFCTCGETNPNESRPTCAVCHGFGYFYPFPPEQIRGLISDVKIDKKLIEVGFAMPGDLLFSPLPGTAHLSDFDLIILPWRQGVPSEGEVIVRGSDSTLPANVDNASYRMDWVQGAWTTNADTGVVTPYIPNTDFTWNGRQITWIGNQPAVGTPYSIQYSGMFEWIAYTSPQPRIAFGQDLGQRVVLRKRHIVTTVPLLPE